jgi:hypothetical protein
MGGSDNLFRWATKPDLNEVEAGTAGAAEEHAAVRRGSLARRIKSGLRHEVIRRQPTSPTQAAYRRTKFDTVASRSEARNATTGTRQPPPRIVSAAEIIIVVARDTRGRFERELALSRWLMQRLDFLQGFLLRPLGLVKIMAHLKVHPEAGTRPEVPTQSERRRGTYGSPTTNDLIDPLKGDMDGVGKLLLFEPHRLKELFSQDLSGMGWFSISRYSYHMLPHSS